MARAERRTLFPTAGIEAAINDANSLRSIRCSISKLEMKEKDVFYPKNREVRTLCRHLNDAPRTAMREQARRPLAHVA